MPGPEFSVHESAIVESGARIGDGTSIWHHAHVRSDADVGRHCVLGKNVYVDAGAVIGDRVKVQNNVSVYVGVTIGDDVFVGPSAVFTNDRVPRAFNTEWEVTSTIVERGASIGANATVVCGVTLGEYCMIAAGAVVTHDVAAHELVAGCPARHVGWVCRCGRSVSRAIDRPTTIDCDECEETS